MYLQHTTDPQRWEIFNNWLLHMMRAKSIIFSSMIRAMGFLRPLPSFSASNNCSGTGRRGEGEIGEIERGERVRDERMREERVHKHRARRRHTYAHIHNRHATAHVRNTCKTHIC